MSPHVRLLDVETTGFTPPVVPIELAIGESSDPDPRSCKLDNVTHRFFNPGKPIEWGAVSSHHVIPGDLVNQPPWSQEHAAVPADCYLVGHNIDYDWDVIGRPEPVKRICTLALSRHVAPEMDSHRLAAMIYSIYGQNEETREKVRGAHSAINDMFMMLDVLRYIANNLEIKTWEALWEMSELARIPKILTFGKNKGVAISEIDRHDPGYRKWMLRQQDIDPYLRKALEALGPV